MLIDYKKCYMKAKDKIEGIDFKEDGFSSLEREEIVNFLEIPSKKRGYTSCKRMAKVMHVRNPYLVEFAG